MHHEIGTGPGAEEVPQSALATAVVHEAPVSMIN